MRNPVDRNPEVQGQRTKVHKVRAFEDLNVYTRARDLTNRIYDLTRRTSFARDYALVGQIRRASVSVMSNIAEGFERGTNAEFAQFLFIAKGSCGEVRAQIAIAYDQGYIQRSTYETIAAQARRVSGMLANLIGYLRQSRYRGMKYKKPPFRSMAEEVDEFFGDFQRRRRSEQD